MCGVLGVWIVAARLCKPDQRAGQFILQRCRRTAFSTDACIPGAAAASRCLLTLKTKHFMFHIDLSFDFLIDYLRIV